MAVAEMSRKRMSDWQKELIQANQKKRVSKETIEKAPEQAL